LLGEAADGLTAIELITRLRPEVAILDVQLPDLNGLEVARRVHEQVPRCRVVMLSMFADEVYVLEALRHGAMAYVLKASATSDLVAAVSSVRERSRRTAPSCSASSVCRHRPISYALPSAVGWSRLWMIVR
jgi:DNA-binding NarL/FixJ family response regulator